MDDLTMSFTDACCNLVAEANSLEFNMGKLRDFVVCILE